MFLSFQSLSFALLLLNNLSNYETMYTSHSEATPTDLAGPTADL